MIFRNRYTFYSYCLDKLYVEANIFNQTSSLNNCKVVLKDRNGNKFGCFSCNHGFTGKVILYSVEDP